MNDVKESQVTVRPKEVDELFANPGMGWQTFHRFSDEDKNLQGLPSSSAYFRFYWSDIEPAVYLAIESRTEDGWYPLSHIEVNDK